jgi:hypothetical protein
MDLLTIDFETYYDKKYSLKKLTTEQYVRDDKFEIIGFAMQSKEMMSLPCGTQVIWIIYDQRLIDMIGKIQLAWHTIPCLILLS